MNGPLRIANGCGFLGDDLDAPRRLVEGAQVDVLTLEYLAELTLSILAAQRQRDPDSGYARDFLEVAETLTPALKHQCELKIVTNAGGVNPVACVRALSQLLVREGLGAVPVGVVAGDDLLSRLEQLQAQGHTLAHLDTKRPLADLNAAVVSANAYLGSEGIVDCLRRGARIVVTGRVADASLTVGPARAAFGWSGDEWQRLAGAALAGHLIECGAQVTGGYSTSWDSSDLQAIGYPIAELDRDGQCVITKPEGSGGCVNRRTVVEQMVYEIGDPARYLTPDVTLDLTAVDVREVGHDRVAVGGARGEPAGDRYKVSIAYAAGYMAASQLVVYGPDCIPKARRCAELIRGRLASTGDLPADWHVELLGADAACPVPRPASCESSQVSSGSGPAEVVLRIAVSDAERRPVERFTRAVAPLITSGPAGLAGYAVGRSPVRPVLAYWPALIDRSCVRPETQVQPAADWLRTPSLGMGP